MPRRQYLSNADIHVVTAVKIDSLSNKNGSPTQGLLGHVPMPFADFNSKTPLIGMGLVFLAMAIVAVTAYWRAGWYSIIGYAIAAGIAVFGFVFAFRDMPAPQEGSDLPAARDNTDSD